MSKIEKALKKAQSERAVINKDLVLKSEKGLGSEQGVGSGALTVKKSNTNSLIRDMGEESVLSLENLIQRKIIFPEMESTGTANNYRVLRTKLLQKAKSENFSVLITSCSKGFDSSYVTVNLSAAFSLDESKTSLIVDCNIEDSRIDKILGVKNINGLSDYIKNQDVAVEDVIQNAGIPRLRVIPAGLPDSSSSEHFTSARMKNLIDGLIDRYPDRYLFIDAPPALDSVDTKILVELCDFVIIVVPYAKVTANQISSCVKAINEEKLLGFVMSDVL